VNPEIKLLQDAIAAQEQLRAVVGDALVDATIDLLRKQLEELEKQPIQEQIRKQVTILFADIAGFTKLAEAMDSEEVGEILNLIWQRVDTTIQRFGGRVDKHIGDGVMALWGVNLADENDPVQAIRAALEIQQALENLVQQRHHTLRMRISIHTGMVWLGEVGVSGEFTAIGDAVNLASRLEKLAPIGGVLITSTMSS